MLIKDFLNYLRLERNYSERTIVAYEADLREFEEYFKKTDAELDFRSVHSDNVRNWMVSLMDEGRTETSVNRKLSSLRSFYRFLLRRKEITVNPMLKVVGPKKKKPLPSFVREKDMDRLLDETSFEEGFEGVDPQPLHERINQALSSIGALVLSDYAKGALASVQQMIQLARKAGVPVLIDPKGTDFERYRGATLLTPNLSEFEAVVGKCKTEEEIVEQGFNLIIYYFVCERKLLDSFKK